MRNVLEQRVLLLRTILVYAVMQRALLKQN